MGGQRNEWTNVDNGCLAKRKSVMLFTERQMEE